MNAHASQEPKLAGVDYPEQDLSVLGAFAIVAVAFLVLRGRK